MRRSIVLSPPFQLVFPVLTLKTLKQEPRNPYWKGKISTFDSKFTSATLNIEKKFFVLPNTLSYWGGQWYWAFPFGMASLQELSLQPDTSIRNPQKSLKIIGQIQRVRLRDFSVRVRSAFSCSSSFLRQVKKSHCDFLVSQWKRIDYQKRSVKTRC